MDDVNRTLNVRKMKTQKSSPISFTMVETARNNHRA